MSNFNPIPTKYLEKPIGATENMLLQYNFQTGQWEISALSAFGGGNFNTPATSDLDMNNHQIKGLAPSLVGTDAINKDELDATATTLESSLSGRIDNTMEDASILGNKIIATIGNPADNTLTINSFVYVNPKGSTGYLEFAGGQSLFLPVSTAGKIRYDLLVLTNNQLEVIQGTEEDTITGSIYNYVPKIPKNSLGLYAVRIDEDTTVQITASDVFPASEFLTKGFTIEPGDFLQYTRQNDYGELQPGGDIHYFIDSTNGDDTTGDGTQGNPFKTIPRALEVTPIFFNGGIAMRLINNEYIVHGEETWNLPNWERLDTFTAMPLTIKSATATQEEIHIHRDVTLPVPTFTQIKVKSFLSSIGAVWFHNLRITDVAYQSNVQTVISWSSTQSTWTYANLFDPNGTTELPMLNGSFIWTKYDDTSTNRNMYFDVTGMATGKSFRYANIVCSSLKLQASINIIQNGNNNAWAAPFVIERSDAAIIGVCLAITHFNPVDLGVETLTGTSSVIFNSNWPIEIRKAHTGIMVGSPGLSIYTVSVNSANYTITTKFGLGVAITDCTYGIRVRRNLHVYGDATESGTDLVTFTNVTTHWQLDSGATADPYTAY